MADFDIINITPVLAGTKIARAAKDFGFVHAAVGVDGLQVELRCGPVFIPATMLREKLAELAALAAPVAEPGIPAPVRAKPAPQKRRR